MEFTEIHRNRLKVTEEIYVHTLSQCGNRFLTEGKLIILLWINSDK